MTIAELIENRNNLPSLLAESDFKKLIDRINSGDENATEKIIIHYFWLVLEEVDKNFSDVNLEKEDLISAGTLGLVFALNYYSRFKKTAFIPLAIRCINDEIISFINCYENDIPLDSMDRCASYDENGNMLNLTDITIGCSDPESAYIKREICENLYRIINKLSERDKKIVMLFFGFYNDRTYSQKEISKIVSVSLATTSRVLRCSVNKLRRELYKLGLTDLDKDSIESMEKKRETQVIIDNWKMRKKSIYDQFSQYPISEVDSVIKKLTKKEKKLILLRFGPDPSEYTPSGLNQKETHQFYKKLLPKMKELLDD